MIRIEVIVRPWNLDEVRHLLAHPWVSGLTVTEVKGHAGAAGAGADTAVHRGTAYPVGVEPRLKVEVVVPAPLAARLVEELCRGLRTGRPGDGKLFLVPVDGAVRVRTGERGEEAL